MKEVSADGFIADSWRLAAAIEASGWTPDAIFAIWRGGALPGIAVHEYFKAAGNNALLAPITCESYSAPGKNAEPRWLRCAETFDAIEPGWKILAIDDIFDTGATMASLSKIVEERGAEMKSACIYWNPRDGGARPDWWARKTDGEWLAFPHELEGLPEALVAKRCPWLQPRRTETIRPSSPSA